MDSILNNETLPVKPLSRNFKGISASCHDEYHFIGEHFYSLVNDVYAWFKGVKNEQ